MNPMDLSLSPIRAWRNESFSLRIDCPPPASDVRFVSMIAEIDLKRIRLVGAGKAGLVPDPLEPIDPDSGTPDGRMAHGMWLTGRVRPDAPAGLHRISIPLGEDRPPLELTLEVVPAQLPSPRDYTFFLDLWQHPTSVARTENVPLWSEDHWKKLERSLSLFAEAGQKVITATILHDPWGSQTFDPHVSMIRWIRGAEGKLRFDPALFDRYVELCMKLGIRERIHCYSTCLGPGPRKDCVFRVENELGGHEDIGTEVGGEPYIEMWKAFFEFFIPHLREKGWIEKTCVAMDEKPPEVMDPMLDMVRRFAPELGIALAGNYHPHLDRQIRDYSVICPGMPREAAEARRQAGKTSTFYVCCGPARPNTFTTSPPVESRQLPWYAAATGVDGFLRWAFESFNEDPLHETAFGPFPPGDCFLCYPGARTCIRFEMLKKGIEDFEIIRIAREMLGETGPERERMEALIASAADTSAEPSEIARRIEEARAYIDFAVHSISG